MLATYASFLVVLGSSALVGQAILAAGGRRAWSPLAPAIGLAAVVALAWAAVRLPGEGVAVLIGLGLALAGSALYLVGRVGAGREAVAVAGAVVALAAVAGSLPFIVEGRFGILGTGLNPDMSQHLLAADRLAAAGSDRLIVEGYPLGPHALVVGVAELGPSLVHAFGGLTLAVAVSACLAPLALLGELPAVRRIAGALAIGFAYLVASFLVQGAFKETIQALFVVAFAIALHELVRDWPTRAAAPRALRAIPLAVLGVGSVYAYSFPGLTWLVGAAGAWGAVELAIALRDGGLARARRLVRQAAPAVAVALALLGAAVAPEVGRLIEFARFETFDPDGPGLGNLFNRLSPLEALGIWPSGDFRVEPGDGFAPAIAFYLGAALALGALALGLRWWLRRGERAVPAALVAAVVLWGYSLTVGTPYQEAKALVLAAPLVMLIAVRALLAAMPASAAGIEPRAPRRLVRSYLAPTFLAAALGCSALALVNGPVGPAQWSPRLIEARESGALTGPVLALAPERFLSDEHGFDLVAWELRGGEVCVLAEGAELPSGVTEVIAVDRGLGRGEGVALPEAPFPGLEIVSGAGRYTVWRVVGAEGGSGVCPFIADGDRAEPAAVEGQPDDDRS